MNELETPTLDAAELKQKVREHYAEAARSVSTTGTGCCGITTSACCADPISGDLYDEAQTGTLPTQAVQASLGCGNPTALVSISEGQTVLDLGSGGGIDVLLSSRRVGPAGKVYGLDMTDEMLELARENQRRAGATNVEFLKGDMESIPLPDGSVDVVISNCVINLAADKGRVLKEAFRVLRPGGTFAVSDIVVRGEMPAELKRHVELWCGCIAGALTESDYRAKLAEAGFAGVDVTPTRVYTRADAADLLAGVDAADIAPEVDGKFMSAFVRATKAA